MKKIYFSLLAIAMSLTASFAAETITVNSAVTANIEITAAGDYVLDGDFTQCTFPVIVAENLGNVTITTKNVKVYPSSSAHGIQIGEGTTLTLKIDGTNHYQGKSTHSGIEVLGNLIIESVNGANTDSLYTLGSNAPGIGIVTSGKKGGDITINSGVVYCEGKVKSAGLGTSVYSGTTQLGTITINGGRVYGMSTGGGDAYAHAAGIGTGYYNNDYKGDVKPYEAIVINGGYVYAQGWGDAAGIGGVKNTTSGGDITINGGTVVAKGAKYSQQYPGIGGYKSFVGKITITGGSIDATIGKHKEDKKDPLDESFYPVNAAGTQVAQWVATTDPGLQIKGGSITGTDYNVVLGTDYGIKDVRSDGEGKVYFWLANVPTDAVATFQTNKIDLSTTAANITEAGEYVIANGTGTNSITVAANLGNVTIGGSNVIASAMTVGAGTTVSLTGYNAVVGNAAINGAVIVNGGAMVVEGNITGTGTLTLNGGTHQFKGAQPTANIVVNGGNIKTQSASGADLKWTGVKDGAGKDLEMIVGTMKAMTQVKNGFVKGTDYEFILKNNYIMTDMYSDMDGKVYLYVPATLPADAVALFNQLEEIDLDANGSNDINIDSEGAYKLNGTGVRTYGKVNILENAGNVTLTLNNAYIRPSSGWAIRIYPGNVVTLKLEGENTARAGNTYNTGIIVEGDLIIEGPGSLYAEGNTGAGIGGQHQNNDGTKGMGNLTINGGTIEAKGGTYAAGIGLAYVGKARNNDADTTVITINGGTIKARAGEGEYSIGRANGSSKKVKLVINGGSINSLNSSGAEFEFTKTLPVAADNTALKLFKTQLAETTAATRVYGGTIGTVTLGEGGYGMNDVYTDAEGYLWFYIPEQAEGAAVNLITTKPVVNYEVIVSAENGTVSCAEQTLTDGKVTVEEGTELTFTATAETGYVFDYWTVNGEKQEGATTELKLMINAETTIVAVFKKDTSTSIDNTKLNIEVRKIVENGHIYILRGDKKYTTTGVVVK